MGEGTEFKPGDKAPNNGHYMEFGDIGLETTIVDPKHVTLRKGERFPETSNKDRIWKKKHKGKSH
ncbi:YjzC family protein [Paenibacillus glacialis]|uniref:YjzC family protein n=1 Tax=Paenibacillus glacialis TaxID=494026 RepID=A0A162MCC5_9BACL|nr:YjzC family protein [Paenibacillus glacialis]OAB42043.1 hypothetical protein PGLA_14615 [Paenibacillus glacialis]